MNMTPTGRVEDQGRTEQSSELAALLGSPITTSTSVSSTIHQESAAKR